MLKLRKLEIERQMWGDEKGRFKGTIVYEGDTGKIELTLDSTVCENLLPIVAEALIASSKEVAGRLTAEAMSSVPLKITG